jgi:hypothetical protein
MSTSLWMMGDEPDLPREVQDAIERGIRQARGLSGDLRRDELLVDRELADPENTPGNVVSTRSMWSAAYMSAG